ncbi:hypothetical protein [Phyllobacterium myrsinacearum]|uniref:Uncharacterized protein n=1 Tax=Phyllobacterium myrsinacearum TaxID=28101 RepID=A0A839ERV1_9HYPH|nr:hypothetical protein [Phyllobacterium myrsinacearum]MBA8881659.1 hypothetical protein [Phyllobacterium myrsinacearum]
MAELTLTEIISDGVVMVEPKADVTAFQKIMAESMKKMASEIAANYLLTPLTGQPTGTTLTAEAMSWAIGGAYRGGKSAMRDLIYGMKMEMEPPERIEVIKPRTMDTFHHLYTQKWSEAPITKTDMPVAKYETEGYPSATVKVFKETMDPRDPLNPNPSAKGGVINYVIKCGDRRLGRYHAEPIANSGEDVSRTSL